MSNFNKYWTARGNSKKAEVFTPSFLVREMLDKIPSWIWESSETLFLDLCFGSGTFIQCIVEKLREYGHSDENISRRIWGIDISRKWYNRVKHFRVGEYNIENIYCGDSLNTNILDNMKFDVIIGNPPYNSPSENRGKKKGSSTMLWPLFVDLAFKIVNKNGIVGLITPNKWRTGKFSQNRMLGILPKIWEYKFIFVKDATRDFSVASHLSLDAWIVDTSKKNTLPKEYQEFYFYPLKSDKPSNIMEFIKLRESDENYTLDINRTDNRNRDILIKSKKGDANHPYPYMNTSSQFKDGFFDWDSKKTSSFDRKKVLISNTTNINTPGIKIGVYDDGKIGPGHNTSAYSIQNEKEGKKLENFLNNSRVIKDIIREYNGPTGYAIPLQILSKIPKSLVERFNNGEDL